MTKADLDRIKRTCMEDIRMTDVLDLIEEVERMQAEIDRVAPFLAVHGFPGYRMAMPTAYGPTEGITSSSSNTTTMWKKEG